MPQPKNSRNETQFAQLPLDEQRRIILASLLGYANPVNSAVIRYHLSEYARVTGVTYAQALAELESSARSWVAIRIGVLS